MSEAGLLSRGNWQQAAMKAIAELPPDILESVGYSQPTDKSLTIRVAVEPITVDEGEASISEVRVVWWDTVREQLAEYIRESPGMGIEENLHDAERRNQADWPVISIEGDSGKSTTGHYPGRVRVVAFQSWLQLSILEEMHSGGMILKDNDERFIRKDGSLILGWQAESE